MTAFRFALQPLLDARQRAEDEARARLFAAASAHARDLARAQALRAAFVRAGRVLAAPEQERDARAVREALSAADLYATATTRADAAARESAARESAAREAFAGARRERRQIEALRDRARAAFRERLARAEECELDEAANRRHNAATLFASSFHN